MSGEFASGEFASGEFAWVAVALALAVISASLNISESDCRAHELAPTTRQKIRKLERVVSLITTIRRISAPPPRDKLTDSFSIECFSRYLHQRSRCSKLSM